MSPKSTVPTQLGKWQQLAQRAESAPLRPLMIISMLHHAMPLCQTAHHRVRLQLPHDPKAALRTRYQNDLRACPDLTSCPHATSLCSVQAHERRIMHACLCLQRRHAQDHARLSACRSARTHLQVWCYLAQKCSHTLPSQAANRSLSTLKPRCFTSLATALVAHEPLATPCMGMGEQETVMSDVGANLEHRVRELPLASGHWLVLLRPLLTTPFEGAGSRWRLITWWTRSAFTT